MKRQYFDAVNWETAELIKGKTGIVEGKCLELNVGDGCLGMALAEQTQLELYLLVNSDETLQRMTQCVGERHQEHRMHVLKGSNLKIPLMEQMIDLVVSKSSVFLWQNRVATFREIYRVLAPGGVACLCGGFETADLKCRMDAKPRRSLVKRQPGSPKWQNWVPELETTLCEAGIGACEMNYSDSGLWILIRKPPRLYSVNSEMLTYNIGNQ